MHYNTKWGKDVRISEYYQTKMALGSDVDLNIATRLLPADAEAIFTQVWQMVFEFERQFSRFLPASELSSFNRSAGTKQLVTPAFRDLLVTARDLSLRTNGLYNPFILPALQRAGYKQSAAPGYESDPVDDHSNKQVVGADQLEIGDSWARIPYGTALDMGGCGKGYLADKLKKLLSAPAITGYWLSMGGDVQTFGADAQGSPWEVEIQNARDTTKSGDWIIVCPTAHFAIATSGTFRRPNQRTGGSWHHIIDPITLKPAQTDIRLATVCMESSVMADVLASCAVIVGERGARSLLRKHKVDAYLLQAEQDGKPVITKHGTVFHKKITNRTAVQHA